MAYSNDDSNARRMQVELADLEREWVEVNGRLMKPSQCYRLGLDPLHILFNTNCPETLQKRIQAIIKKYRS